jgi:hypothetical protein
VDDPGANVENAAANVARNDISVRWSETFMALRACVGGVEGF